jgi:DNA invertase Pin-like site-specific DNA recombinase
MIAGTGVSPLEIQRFSCTVFLYRFSHRGKAELVMLIGYARVSATHQNLDRQLAALKAARCRKIYREKLSGREGVKRPELEKAIDALGPGDVLVLAEWDRAARSMLDGIRIIERVAARKASLKALDRQWLDLTTTLGKGILAFLSALAEDERARILARANGGRAAARKRGVKFGPKPKLAAHQEREVARMVHVEGLSLRAVAHHYHVGHSTIVRALGRAGSSSLT